MVEDGNVDGHPRMAVAPNAKDFSSLQLEGERLALNRLRGVEVVTGHRRRVRVVLRWIVVSHFQRLPHACGHYTRRVLAILLINEDGHRRHWRRRERSIEVDEHIRERAVRADDKGRRCRTLA